MRVVVRIETFETLNGPTYVAACATGDCTWRSRSQVVKVAAEDEGRYHREHHRREVPS